VQAVINELDLGNYLHLGDLSGDEAASLACEVANLVVREYCGWVLFPSTVETVFLDGDGTDILKLPTMALSMVNTVVLDGVLIDPADYEWSDIGYLYYPVWTAGVANVLVNFEHGYTTRPGGPTLVALTIAAREYGNPERLSQASAGTVTRRWLTNELETRLLDPFRLP
jgi:hypothetical protein